MNQQILLLHQLAWRPCQYMHALWWRLLGIDSWKDYYSPNSLCGRYLDNLTTTLRQFPSAPLPTQLSEHQQKLLSLLPNMPMLITALGIISLGCADYLAIKAYREKLSPYLTNEQIQQIWSLWPGGHCAPELNPTQVILKVQQSAVAALCHEWEQDIVWQSIMITLPPAADNAPKIDATKWLFRLNHFL